MRSTFSVLFYTKNQSLKDGKVPIMGRIIIPETKIAVVDTFSCHQAVMVADILVMPCDLGLDIAR